MRCDYNEPDCAHCILDGGPLAVAKSSDWENTRLSKPIPVGPKLSCGRSTQEEVP